MNTPLPVTARRFRASCAWRLIVPIFPDVGLPLVGPEALLVPWSRRRAVDPELLRVLEDEPLLLPRLIVGLLELPPSRPREGAELPELPPPLEEGALRV